MKKSCGKLTKRLLIPVELWQKFLKFSKVFIFIGTIYFFMG
ncbi:hypothetical protein RV00_GL000073 [Enterococcus devriesei]|uniref:Uncharacterized protein n=1 Tax=Enterococcus devriesei TaxID=319970 RepID=A0A1L8SYM7_9ENTE|nr:hypothetical protein RV00_GL000073 [Enterococcus devriesei]